MSSKKYCHPNKNNLSDPRVSNGFPPVMHKSRTNLAQLFEIIKLLWINFCAFIKFLCLKGVDT